MPILSYLIFWCSFLLVCGVVMEKLLTLTQKELCILFLISVETKQDLVVPTQESLAIVFSTQIYAIFLFSWLGQSIFLCFHLNCKLFSRPDRIVPIAERFGLDPGAVLDNVRFLYLVYHEWGSRSKYWCCS